MGVGREYVGGTGRWDHHESTGANQRQRHWRYQPDLGGWAAFSGAGYEFNGVELGAKRLRAGGRWNGDKPIHTSPPYRPFEHELYSRRRTALNGREQWDGVRMGRQPIRPDRRRDHDDPVDTG